MSGKRKGEYVGVLGALLVHVAIIALLILVSFTVPNNQDEGGVPTCRTARTKYRNYTE